MSERTANWTVVITTGWKNPQHVMTEIKAQGYHTYASGNTVAIEVKDATKSQARAVGQRFGTVVNIFE